MFNTCTKRAAEERLKCVICQDEEVSFFITPGDKTRLNNEHAHCIFCIPQVGSVLTPCGHLCCCTSCVDKVRFSFVALNKVESSPISILLLP